MRLTVSIPSWPMVLGACATAGLLQAQAAPSPSRGARPPEITAARHAFVVAQVLEGPGWFPDSAATLRALRASCPAEELTLHPAPRAVDRIADSLLRSGPVLRVAVVPRHPSRSACASPELLALHAVVLDPVAGPEAPLGSVRITSSRGQVDVLASARERLQVAQTRQLAIDPDLRLWEFLLPASILAPDARGDLPTLTVRILDSAGRGGDDVLISGEMARRLWKAALPGRIAARDAGRRESRARVEFPRMHDPALERAAAALRDGDPATAATRVLERELEKPGPDGAGVDAEMLLTAALLALDDLPDARAVIAPMLASRPCLAFPPGAPASYQAVLEELRPRPARCDLLPSGTLAGRLLVPGLVQWTTGRRAAGATGFLATAVLGALSVTSNARASRQFSEYESATDPGTAMRLHREASAARRGARSFAIGAVAAVAASSADAVLGELRLRRRLSALGPYRARIRATATAPSHAGRASMTLGVAIR